MPKLQVGRRANRICVRLQKIRYQLLRDAFRAWREDWERRPLIAVGWFVVDLAQPIDMASVRLLDIE